MITRQEAAELLDVSPQTISNWVEKGVLNSHSSCDGRKTMLIDRRSIERYFDSLDDLASMENQISLQKEELSVVSMSLESRLREMNSTKFLFGDGISRYLLREIFGCVVSVAGEEVLNDREYQILSCLVDRMRVSDIAGLHDITTTRVMQLASKAISKICTMKSWPEYHREYKHVLDENHRLAVLLENQQIHIKNLETRLNVINGDGGESAVAGYTKLELAYVLGRRLVEENLSVRCLNCLHCEDIETVSDLVRRRKTDLLKLRNFGKKTLAELEDFLSGLHLSFGMDIDRLVDAEVELYLQDLNKNTLKSDMRYHQNGR